MKKRLTLVSLFIALVINAMAYTPIVIEGYKWNIVNRKAMLDANGTIEYKTMIEKIEGDTIINEVSYKKLWHSCLFGWWIWCGTLLFDCESF